MTRLIIGNWKMNTTISEAMVLASAIKTGITEIQITDVETVLCPPFISLWPVHNIIKGSPIKLGAQNTHFEPQGAFTGEISPDMLSDICEFVIIGHSERRRLMRENSQVINRKMCGAFSAGLRPILCVGETLEQRSNGLAEQVVRRQIKGGIRGLHDISHLIIAYEPVWAIGTGLAATPIEVVDIINKAIRWQLTKLYGEFTATQVPVLYGGSITSENVSAFLQESSLQGALVGGASLHAKDFVEIVRLTAEIDKLQ